MNLTVLCDLFKGPWSQEATQIACLKISESLPMQIMKKKPKPGRGGRGGGRPITKTEPVDSFFSFFAPPQVPEDEEDNDLEEADLEALQSALEEDYELGYAPLTSACQKYSTTLELPRGGPE